MSQRSFFDHVEKEKERKKFGQPRVDHQLEVDNLSLREFPKEDRFEIRRQWINFVETKWKDFTTPTMHSMLCEIFFFTTDCYPKEYSLIKSVGITVKRKSLLKDAVVPSIHFSGTMNSSILGKRTSSSHGGNFKGEISRPSQPKKIRPAFLKRECFRVRDS